MQNWNRLREVFDQALEQPAASGEAWVRAACSTDAALCEEVLGLLKSHADASGFFGSLENALSDAFLPQADMAGKQVGAYTLQREIGRGGMAVVYLAQRTNGGFDQQVALKILRTGFDTEELVQRFRYERQLLAQLYHPHIARLLDGGITPDGLPYFAMECIDGVSITQFVRENTLTQTATLKLFQQVLGAIQYAHRNLIIHRDIKPGNILVTPSGEVKLLDFGIAKVLSGGEMADSAFGGLPLTRTGMRLMTPEYASPEQIREEILTTAHDVYQLGLLLYELLAGRCAFSFEEMSTLKMAQEICERQPEPLLIDRDLGTIVQMALRKEPERRYASVEQFSHDIGHFLLGLPVIARENSSGYRMRKFVARNKIKVVAALAVILSMMVGLAAFAWAAQIARREQIRAEQTAQFLKDLFSSPDPRNAAGKGKDVTVAQFLDVAVQNIHRNDSFPADLKLELLGIVADMYEKLDHAQPAWKLYGELSASSVSDNAPQAHRYLLRYAVTSYQTGKVALADSVFRQAQRAVRAQPHGSTSREMAEIMREYALYQQVSRGNLHATDSLLRIAEGIFTSQKDTLNSAFGDILSIKAVNAHRAGKLPEAEAFLRRELAIKQRTHGDPVALAVVKTNLVALMIEQNSRLSEAEAVAREALGVFEQKLGEKHEFAIRCRNNLVAIYANTGRYREGKAMALQVLREMTVRYGASSVEMATICLNVSNQAGQLGEADSALIYAQRSLDAFGAALPKGHYLVSMGLAARASAYNKLHRYPQALQDAQQALALISAVLPLTHFLIGGAKTQVGMAQLGLHNKPEAKVNLEDGYRILLAAKGETHYTTRAAKEALGKLR